MPMSQEYAENLSAVVVGLYRDAEQIMLGRIAKALAADFDAPDWSERKLLQIQLLQLQTSKQLQQLTGRSAEQIAAAVVKAYNRGAAMAQADLDELLRGALAEAALPPGLPAVERLVTEAVGTVTATHGRILRAVPDVFHDVIAATSPQVLLGTQTRREAAQAALDRFASRGVAGFVDRAGRQWALESYVEMATRAATANAAIQGHVDRLLANGQDLVIVSDAPQECVLCRPWEGKILSLSGVRRADGVTVAGTLLEAKAAGFQHPGCRHSIGIYLPGVTTAPTGTADPQGDADRQQLRYLERQVRSWKRRQMVALDSSAEVRAQQRVRGYQRKIREHVEATSAKRQPQRERLGAL